MGRQVCGVAALVLLALAAQGAAAAPVADRPSLSSIEATFSAQTRGTTYEVRLRDPEPVPTGTWQWTLEPPANDPNCRKFEVTLRGQVLSRAIWHHADEDGCTHVGTDHPGRITVTVTSGDYECTAAITGSTTHTGPEPDPCFKRPSTPPPPPPPASTSAPSISAADKERWRLDSAALFAAGAASYSLAIGCALVPSPDPVSKGLAVVGALVGLGQYAAAGWAYLKYKDPPDKNYKRLAKVVVPALPRVNVGSGITPAEAAAVNALTENLVRTAAYDAAFIASFERAQGAYAARDGTWDRRQSRAAAAHARAEARLLDARPGLESALRRAIEQARVPALTAAEARRATQRIAKTGLSSSFVANAKRLGLGGAPLTAFEKVVRKGEPGTIAGPVAPKFGTKAAADAYRRSAQRLRALAARLDKR